MASVRQLKAEAVENVRMFVEEMVRLRPTTDMMGVHQIAAALRRGGYAAYLELAVYQLIKDGMFEPLVRSEVKFTREVVYLTPKFRREVLGEGGDDRQMPLPLE